MGPYRYLRYSLARLVHAARDRMRSASGRFRPGLGESPGSSVSPDYPDLECLVERLLAWGRPHEEDFKLYRHMDGLAGTFVDVGANWGQSMVSFRLFCKTFRVISFEPNPLLAPALAALQRRLPQAFEYHMFGLGAANEVRKLTVPFTQSMNLSPSGSLDPKEFEKAYVQERLARESQASAGQFGFYETEAEIRVFDELGIAPDIVKVDVEGWETEVLAGMRQTIAQRKPMFMIELNNPERLLPAMRAFGYRPFAYDPARDLLKPWSDDYKVLNLFFLHPERLDFLRQTYGLTIQS
jgi:FkbM family methyltransferase